MEFEVLSEKIERECQRVAIAFGVQQWEDASEDLGYLNFIGESSANASVTVSRRISIGNSSMQCTRSTVSDKDAGWCDVCFGHIVGRRHTISSEEAPLELMARGLFRLGFDDEGVLAQLPALSVHERTELYLSLPREFWLPQWVDESVVVKAVADVEKVLLSPLLKCNEKQ